MNKPRKHKYGKNNKLRIKAGLPPLARTPLQPQSTVSASSPSVIAIQAGEIENLQDRVSNLEQAYIGTLATNLTQRKN
jgi:hypothetical protein